MFLPDWQPITVDLPTEWEFAHLYFVHDLHYGSELFDERKWMRLKKRYVHTDRKPSRTKGICNATVC